MVKICLPAQGMQETWLGSWAGKILLGKETATRSSILAWEIPRAEESDELQSVGPQRVGHEQETVLHTVCLRYKNQYHGDNIVPHIL